MTEWRRDFHMNPELAFEEVRTSNIIAEKLESWGIQVSRNVKNEVLLGHSGQQNFARVFRPIYRFTSGYGCITYGRVKRFHYRSRVPGKSWIGHDGHTTMLLGAAQYLAETRNFGSALYFSTCRRRGWGGLGRRRFIQKFPCDQIWYA